MKVLICDKTEADAIEKMRSAGLTVDVRDTITPEELMVAAPEYEAMVVRSRTKLRAPLIDAAKKLKVIVRGGVGLDNIDADYARSKGITVMNTPKASSASVAELAIGYMFALARSLCQATASMKAGQWEKKKFEGYELGGKTLGIIGVGNIGKEVAKRAAALGMHVVAYDPYAKTAEGIKLVDLDTLLAQADYISLHLPHTDESHNMISKAQFDKMKTGVRIVNCARGGIVDEDALYDAILAGKVAGAALDVFASEPCQGHKLFTLEQVIGSPTSAPPPSKARVALGLRWLRN